MELRRLREAAGLTLERVAEDLEVSDSKISRIETGRVAASPRDVRDMLDLYKITGEQREELLEITRHARQKGWWHIYGGLPRTLVGLEAAAVSIRTYETQLVPGLLQTAEYARAVIRALSSEVDPEQTERRVELRIARRALLTQEDPPALWAILDEAALRRPVGRPATMREQLDYLREAAMLPKVTLQVLPFSAGEHAGMTGAFTILGFSEPTDPDVVYLEQTTSDLYLENIEDIQWYKQAFDHLRTEAMEPDDSVAFLGSLAKKF